MSPVALIFFYFFLLLKDDFCLYVYMLYLFSVLEVFSEGRSKNQFLFMFTGCFKCFTFLFIDVIVGWFVLLFVLRFCFCFQMF